ncbi:phosphatidylinositol 3-kinase catalytic subunit alpha, beta, delta [Tritrichomonas foetus]|uniref:phosphatidylinositol 3-kinase n=1 Tax=Tritrichomonas foetus TaxID=1144522 RepID=A0A1J4JRH3_9EUKA|nr:phosphatidylinositol 3-kinase catalytic subunit alpha, beta, delta [Tritrichomonas foetus]|eukprot:OHT01713.1 phosphatidylinositol 3-kinase catalytic subunit alpha, beta, delta [Tritrichomonas foetus]
MRRGTVANFTPSTSISAESHRIDIFLPNNQRFALPVIENLTGSDILFIIEKKGFSNFVICKNPASSPMCEVLYISQSSSSKNKSNILSNIQPIEFETCQIARDLFTPSRIVSTRFQRMALYVYDIEDYEELIEISKINYKLRRSHGKSHISIKVKLPTNLIISTYVKPEQKIRDLTRRVYKCAVDIYGNNNMNPLKSYKLATISGQFPKKSSTLFKDDQLMMDALKLQDLNCDEPQFNFVQYYQKTKFDKIVASYVQSFDLSEISKDDETRALNASLSRVRTEVEKKRIEILNENPLIARMRISDSEPPLTAYFTKINEAIQQGKDPKIVNTISMKVGLRSGITDSSVTALSIRVPNNVTAEQAISLLIEKLNTQAKNSRRGSLATDNESLSENEESSPHSNVPSLGNMNVPVPNLKEISHQRSVSDVSVKDMIQRLNLNNNLSSPPNPSQSTSSKQSESCENENEIKPRALPPIMKSPNPDLSSVENRKSHIYRGSTPSVVSRTPTSIIEYNADDYVLVIRGMEEVIAGNTPLTNFVSVRQFLLSSRPMLDLLLVEKKIILDSIQAREMNTKSENVEPTQSELSSAIYATDKFDDVVPSLKGMPGYPSLKVESMLNIFVKGVFGIQKEKTTKKYILKVSAINGTSELCEPVFTKAMKGHSTVLFNESINLPISISSLPQTTRISFTLYNNESNSRKERSAIATYNFAVYSFNGWMRTAEFTRKMWLDKDQDFFLTTCESNEEFPPSIQFSFPTFHFPVAFNAPKPLSEASATSPKDMDPEDAKRLIQLIKEDPLYELTNEDKALLFQNRTVVCQFRELLPFTLLSINYSDPSQVVEIPNILKIWAKPKPTEALALLDAKFPDRNIREYAVQCLEEFTDNEIMLYLLQLVQALKYELYNDSPLIQFLVRRGLLEPKFLGHQLFWQLMSEAHLSHIRMRFSAILVNFVYGIGSSFCSELLKGYKFTQELVELNQKLRKLSYSDATQPFRDALENIEIPKEFHLPMDPRLVVESFIIDKCKVMNSKKKPFWLAFKNASPFATEPVLTMFKVGDDLRQDQLTLQVMKVMEHVWRQDGKDYHMRCYGVLPTGFNQGFIEVVPYSLTEAALQQEKGTLSGVFDKETFSNYLKKHNPSQVAYETAKNNFRLSSAGYAVATCVLGVADRHPGNIMVQQDGHFFHIDFGHFLGNFKTKLGYQRENAPFHFSPACAYVLDDVDGPAFKQFLKDAGVAYNILRKNSRLLLTLFLLMLGTGIPELQNPKDIDYFKNMLCLTATEEEAAAEFVNKTKHSMDSTRTKLNNLFHNIKTAE